MNIDTADTVEKKVEFLLDFEKKNKKKIYDRNRRFNKLSSEKKRVRIAKDVLEQLEARQIIATHGTYLSFAADMKDAFGAERGYKKDKWTNANIPVEPKGIGLHTIFENTANCKVCALGGVFISAVKRADGMKASECDRSSFQMRNYLQKWFELNQLGLIEAAFEADTIFAVRDVGGYNSARDAERARNFGLRFYSPGDRMSGIMKNIVKNNGTFIP